MHIGEVVAGRFRIEAPVASGGMGTVYRAFDLVSVRLVALKTCLTPGTEAAPADPRMRGARTEARGEARFVLEARALSEISDSAIVGYVDHGTTDGGEPFLVMDWVPGASLAERLAGGGLRVDEALLLARDLTRALGVIHARGIVHRDLKPANVMLRDGDVQRAVLVDFGVARRAENVSVTLSGARVGTLLYMAPEQIRDPRGVDGRADVFALGCVLFECLTGVHAFQAEDALGTIAQILLDDAPDPRRFRPELPEEAVAIVRALLTRDREARPRADETLQQRLEACAERARSLDLGAPPRASVVVSGRREAALAAPAIEHPETADDSVDAPMRIVAGFGPVSDRRRGAAPANCFIGRDGELSKLRTLIQSDTGVIVVWGPAGIGKTRIVQELSRRGGPGKRRAVELVDLGQARDMNDALRLILERVPASLRSRERAEDVVGRAFGGLGPCVFALDRVEHLMVELTPRLELWRRAAKDVCYVLISREKLRIGGAVTFEVGPLATVSLADQLATESEAFSPAAALFAERAREADPALQFGPQQRRTIEATVRALDGIPLAIELAAARVNLLGLDGVAARLSKRLELLGGTRGLGPVSEDTMHAALRGSVELLTPAERTAFAQCSVFCSGFSLEAAEAVIDLGPGAPPVLDVIQSLRDKSLLSLIQAQGDAQPRLLLFSVVREYAAIELAHSGQQPELRARHGAYFTRHALELGRDARQHGADTAIRIERDCDDLLLAVEHALSKLEPDVPLAIAALLALEPVINASGPLPAFTSLMDRAISSAETAELGAARLRLIRSRVVATAGRFEAALSDLEQVFAHSRVHRDRGLEAAAELERGVVHHLRRAPEEARVCYERALSLLPHGADAELEGRCIGNLGALLHDAGKLTEAAAYYWRAVHLLEETGENRMRGNFLSNLGVLEQELGAFRRARQHYQQALEILVAAADHRLSAITLGNLGTLEQECAAWERARRCHEQALELLGPLSDAYSEALCRSRLGATLATLGHIREAEEQLNRAQRLIRSAEPSRSGAVRLQRAFLELALARRALRAGDFETARGRLARAAESCAKVEQGTDAEPALALHSDDIRITLRILKPMLRTLEASSPEANRA